MNTDRGPRSTLCAVLAAGALLGGCGVTGPRYSYSGAEPRLAGDEASWLQGADASEAADASPTAPGDARSATTSRYTVQPGESLAGIARGLTGDAANWRELARANGIDDPSALEPGTELTVPASLGGATARVEGPTLDLLGALSRAQRFDATFLLERERFAAARAGTTVARAGLLPQANFTAEAARNTDFEDSGSGDGGGTDAVPGAGSPGGVGGGAGTLIAGDYSETTLTATLDQAIFDRPTWLAFERARIDEDVAATRLVAAHEALVLRVARRYFAVLRAQAELQFRRSDLDATRRQLNRAEREYAVGTVSITDVVEARAGRDLARAQLIGARDALADARDAFAVIVGTGAATFTDAEGVGAVGPEAIGIELAGLGPAFGPVAPRPADARTWVELALEGNAQLIAARGTAEAADVLVGQQRARRLPIVTLGANAVSIDSDGPIPDIEIGTLALTGTLPLLSGGRVTGLIARASADARAAAQNLVEVRRETVRGTREAYRAVLSSIARVSAFEQALESTTQAAEATEAGFRAGIRTSSDVLRALRDQFRAEADLVGARYDYIVGSLELQRRAGALGAGDVRAVNEWLEE